MSSNILVIKILQGFHRFIRNNIGDIDNSILSLLDSKIFFKHDKMSLSNDIIRHELVPYMSIDDILQLCEIYPNLCHDNSLWIDLIKRDFGYEFPYSGARGQYFYSKYIHEISDIPVSKVEGIGGENFELFERILKEIGYTRHGDVYLLDNLPATEADKDLVWNIDLDIEGWSRDARDYRKGVIFAAPFPIQEIEILPKIFSPHGLSYVRLSFPLFAEIYDYYHGQDMFWNGFLVYFENYVKNLAFLEKKYARNKLKQLKEEIYWE